MLNLINKTHKSLLLFYTKNQPFVLRISTNIIFYKLKRLISTLLETNDLISSIWIDWKYYSTGFQIGYIVLGCVYSAIKQFRILFHLSATFFQVVLFISAHSKCKGSIKSCIERWKNYEAAFFQKVIVPYSIM